MTRRDRDRVVVGVDATAVRRRVGPTAWCVLEAIAANADRPASVRSLAVELGICNNAVHRALGVLRAAGLISPIAQSRDRGRFGAGGHRLTVPPSVLAPGTAPSPPPIVEDGRLSRRVRRAVRPVVVEQLSLLEV